MKAHEAPNSFLVPRAIGRTGGDLLARGDQYAEQLDMFREVLDRPARLQILAMIALSDPRNLDREQHARIADIVEFMGYDRQKTGKFDPKLYQRIEEYGMIFFRKETVLFDRRPAGKDAKGRPKYSGEAVFMRLLQEFGFRYEDEDGQMIALDRLPPDDRIEYRSPDGRFPIWAIPVQDEHGRLIKNESGQPRRRPATGIVWRFASRLAEMSRDKATSWVFYRDALEILRSYLYKPAAFELIWLTLFWKGEGYIEISYEKLIRHLDIRSKDQKQVQKAVGEAFQAALDSGIIDSLPTVDPAGKWNKGTNKPRRMSMTYRWRRSKRWTIGPSLAISSTIDRADRLSNEPTTDE